MTKLETFLTEKNALTSFKEYLERFEKWDKFNKEVGNDNLSISYGFRWNATKEGVQYWEQLHKEFNK